MFGLAKDFSNNIISRLSCCMISVFTWELHWRLRPEKEFWEVPLSVEILGMQV
jgi:hypothetical protein